MVKLVPIKIQTEAKSSLKTLYKLYSYITKAANVYQKLVPFYSWFEFVISMGTH